MMTSKAVALITGGTRGIGLGIARCLCAEGWAVVVNGVRPPDQVAGVVASLGQDARYVAADVGTAAGRAHVMAETRRAHARLDMLVNNAGVAPRVRADLLDATKESFDHIMAVNLKSAYFLSRDAARWLIEEREKDAARPLSIVNISSLSAYAPTVNRGEYCVAKAGMAMTTQLFAARLAAQAINVIEIRPGIMATDMTAGVKAKYDRLIAEGLVPMRRWGTPEDVGRMVAAIARGAMTFSTGAVIDVDGGFHIKTL